MIIRSIYERIALQVHDLKVGEKHSASSVVQLGKPAFKAGTPDGFELCDRIRWVGLPAPSTQRLVAFSRRAEGETPAGELDAQA